jgi:hypothetical protein
VGTDVLDIEATEPGTIGNTTRIEVDDKTPDPEITFNMTVYREELDQNGDMQRKGFADVQRR